MSLLAHAGTAVLTMALVSLAAAAARAQTPAGSAQTPKRAASTPLSTWRLGLVADATWYENAYLVGAAGSETWSTGGQLRLDHNRRLSWGTFGIGAYGGKLYYPDYKSYDQAVYGGVLSLNVVRSKRPLFRLSQTYDHTNTRQLGLLDPQAPPLPTSTLDTATSVVSYTPRLSRYWQLALDGNFELRRYADPRLVDGDQALANAQFGRLVGEHSVFYTSYGFLSARFGATDYRAHQALLGARRQPAQGVSADVAAGVAYVETVGRFYPAGSASFGARGRRANFTLSYRRDFGQAYGYGRQTIGDLGAATFGWTLATRLQLSAGYTYGYRRAVEDTNSTIRSQIGSGGLNWGLTKDLGVSAVYSWERNETPGYAYESGRVTGSVSYGVEWR